MDATQAASIEQRLRAIEDRNAICQIICGYGYAVDGLNGEEVGAFYAEDGVYAIESKAFEGRDQVIAIARDEGHKKRVSEGCAHVTTPPYIVIDGDRASATCHTMVMVHTYAGYFCGRLSASRIELSRKPDGGWQIDHRQNFLLDGDERAPALLAQLKEGPGLLTRGR